MNILEVKNLNKKFDDYLVLKNINCEFEEGYIYGLIGINGSGKSTLLRHIVGVYKEDSGEILYNGEMVYENNRAKKEIIFLSDSPSFFHNSTLKSLKKYYGTFYDFDENLFLELNGIFNLDVDKSLNKFSKGMKKQAEFMLGLCCRPKVLVLDETFDGLDPIISHKIKSLLVGYVEEQQITIIISSHNLTDLDNLCDYIYLLDENQLTLRKDFENQENYYKIQLYFNNENLDKNFENETKLRILQSSKVGSITYVVIDEDIDTIKAEIKKLNPVIFEILPFTFEEKFIFDYNNSSKESKKEGESNE